jgi:hypothetical protein
MSEVKIHIPVDTERSESSEDADREEMKWENKQEQYVTQLRDDCLNLSNQHNVASLNNKRRYIRFSLPVIILPLLLGTVSQFVPSGYEYINNVGLTFTGVLNGVNTFYNYGKKATIHNEFAGKYAELAGYISTELVKPKRHRIALDVFLEKITTKLNDINNSAPQL